MRGLRRGVRASLSPRHRCRCSSASWAVPAPDLSGLEVLRTAFDDSRSPATLAPQLVHLPARIRREQPPDRTRELPRAQEAVERFERYGRPGWRTAALGPSVAGARVSGGRSPRSRPPRRSSPVGGASTPTRSPLGIGWPRPWPTGGMSSGSTAVSEQPDHVTALLGSLPQDSFGAERWRHLAARVEAYREEWAVPPERIAEAPTDLVQRTRWRQEVKNAASSMRLLDGQRERAIARSHSRSRSSGLER